MDLKKLLEPENYIPRFLKIRTKDAELVPFVPKPAQLKLQSKIRELRDKGKPVRIIILKARQMGFSTYVEGDIFADTATHKLKNSKIVAHEDVASQNLYTMYKTFYDNLPEELTPMKKYSNSQELVFENPTTDLAAFRKNPGLQSKVTIASARNANAGRSETVHNLHASEVAFWQDPKTLMTALMQCVPDSPNSNIFIESTANGVGGWFYDFWKAAEKGENDFIPMFFAWFEEPTYTKAFDSEEQKEDFIEKVNYVYKDKDGNVVHTEEYELMEQFPEITWEQMNWRKYCIANKCHGDLEKFHQEYPATPDEAFIASGRPRFAVGVLKKYRTKCTKGERGYLHFTGSSVSWVADPKGYLEIWKHPEPGKYYCIGADVAEGLVDGDYSAAYVGDDNFDIAAKWHGHIDPDLYGHELVKLALYYNEAYIGVENNNHGLTTIKAVQSKEYWNIFFSKTYDKINDTVTQKVGWTTNNRTKPLMINKLAEYIREAWLGVRDIEFINECLTYIIEDNGSTNAQAGCHDDTVMAMAILLQVLLEGKGENYRPEVPNEQKKNTVTRAGFTLARDEDDYDIESKVEIAL